MNKEDIAWKQAADVLIQRHYKEYASIYKYKLSRVNDVVEKNDEGEKNG